MNWRAVGYGVLGGVAVVAIQYAIAFLAPLDRHPALVPWVVALNQFLSIAGYAVAGAIAGNFAGRHGAWHGAVHGLAAGLGTAIIGRAFGTSLAVARYGTAALEAIRESAEVLIVWLLISLIVATVAGSVAVRVRAGMQRRAR